MNNEVQILNFKGFLIQVGDLVYDEQDNLLGRVKFGIEENAEGYEDYFLQKTNGYVTMLCVQRDNAPLGRRNKYHRIATGLREKNHKYYAIP